jgi:nucleoside-diphosphate-sugar epimerase
MSVHPRTVLLSGASGVVGRALVERLGDAHVIALVHSDNDVPFADEVVRCDVREPRLGLPRARWDELTRTVDAIVHSAALTRWGQPDSRYDAINVEGTARVAELAACAGAPVHFLSTSFVRAIERGFLDELATDNVVKPYIRSKLAAEQVLRESGIPHSVFRPTNLVGDSRTGVSSKPQIVQRMSSWIARGKAPYFPAHPGNVVDVVPVDVLAAAVAGAVAEGATGGPWWITCGPRAMTNEQALDVLRAHAHTLGRELPDAPIVDPREPLPVPLEAIPATSRAFMRVLLDVSEVTHACGGVLPTSLAELETRFDLPRASSRDAYRRSLEYWAADAAAVATGSKETT